MIVNSVFPGFLIARKKIILLIAFTFLTSIVYYFSNRTQLPVLGVFSGYFCLPHKKKEMLLLKKFHIVPLFVSRCFEGDMGLDSDLDGLCDKDELLLKSNPLERFSFHHAVSDRVWFEVSKSQRQQMESLGARCNNMDPDADMLTNCEELILESSRYESINKSQTEENYDLVTLNINHPDTDEDGFVDGIELRLVTAQAPFIYSNEDLNVDGAEILLNNWVSTTPSEGVTIRLNKSMHNDNCYSYEVNGFEKWILKIDGYQSILQSSELSKFDFLVYGILSDSRQPTLSAMYSAQIVTLNYLNGRFEDNPLPKNLEFKKIGQTNESL